MHAHNHREAHLVIWPGEEQVVDEQLDDEQEEGEEDGGSQQTYVGACTASASKHAFVSSP